MDYMGNSKREEKKTENDDYYKVITVKTVIGIIICLLISFTLLYFGISSKMAELKSGSISCTSQYETNTDNDVISKFLSV